MHTDGFGHERSKSAYICSSSGMGRVHDTSFLQHLCLVAKLKRICAFLMSVTKHVNTVSISVCNTGGKGGGGIL